MAQKLKDGKTDHYGNELPANLYSQVREDPEEIVGYKVKLRQEDEDGIRSRPTRSFSVRKLGTCDRALAAAGAFLEEAETALRVDGLVPRATPDSALTPNDFLPEWTEIRGPQVSGDYAKKVVTCWSRDIEHRRVARMRLTRISEDPSVIAHFQDELVKDGLSASKRYEILKTFRTVMRWGRRRHAQVLTVDLAGLIVLPKLKRSRLAYAADAVGLERLIEAVLNRRARDDLLPLRDAAFLAAMGFTIATRPSEWRLSATWDGLFVPSSHDRMGTIELQRSDESEGDLDPVEGLKTGAHAALVLPNAYERIISYRKALEERFGPQPGNGLIFQVIAADGPVWLESEEGGDRAPMAWTKNNYNQWVKRVFLPARAAAAAAPDAPAGLAKMVFYDCRHTAISLALHSTLVMTPHGMNLHPLAGWSGHDIATLQKYYSHLIARYLGMPPMDILEECGNALATVKASPLYAEKRAAHIRVVDDESCPSDPRKNPAPSSGDLELVAA